jgi:cell division initiation protein
MDLAPELFESVTFREKWRGYDPDDVDDFLERVAVSISDLQALVREANDRVERAEQRSREKVDADESMKRTLVIAQRTADQVLGEADDEATRIVEGAREEAAGFIRRAEHEALRVAEDAQRRLRDDLRALERARDRLRTDVGALERFVDGERARLRDELSARLAEIDDPATLRLGAPPEARDVEVPPQPAMTSPDITADDHTDDTNDSEGAQEQTEQGEEVDNDAPKWVEADDDALIDATAAHRPFDDEAFDDHADDHDSFDDDVSEPAVLRLGG